MKKCLAILAAVCLVTAAAVGGQYALSALPAPERPQTEDEALQQAFSPDLEQLASLGLEPFTSQLPVLMIDTGGQQLQKETVTWVDVAVLDDPSGENNILAAPTQVLTATLKYRGASSYSGFDKPQYRLEFYEDDREAELDYPLCGLGADSEWVLHGPFLDRSLLRNYLMYNLSREVMEWAPGCAFCEVFVDGAYQGVYLAVEPVTDGAARLRLSQFGLVSGATSYIVKRDRVGTEDNVLHTYGETAGYTNQELSVSYPGRSKLTETQFAWITQDISQFEQALYGSSFDDPQLGYAAYIDVDSFAEYFILNEFAMNRDASGLSTYVYKELGGKLQLCVWDFNNSFDNYRWFGCETDEFQMVENNWFDRLLQDRDFVERVVARYRQLRESSLSDAHIEALLQQGLAQLGDAAARNFALWGYTFQSSLLTYGDDGQVRDPESYEEALSMLRDTIQERLDFLDEHIDDLYALCIN